MTRKKKAKSWPSIDYVPETFKTRLEAEFQAILTGKRTRFTEGHGGFVQASGAKFAAFQRLGK